MRSIAARIFAMFAICPLLIGGRTLLQASESVNLIATVTSDSVIFSGDNYGAQVVTMTGAQSIVPFQVTAGVPHGGVWDISQIAGKFIDGAWLGNPDAALYGYNNQGEQVVMLLGALANPQLIGDTLMFNAQILSATDELARVSGVTNYVQAGKGGKLVTDPPVGPLNRIALMIDLAVAYPPQPASAPVYTPTSVQDLGAITRAPPNKRRGPFNTGRGR